MPRLPDLQRSKKLLSQQRGHWRLISQSSTVVDWDLNYPVLDILDLSHYSQAFFFSYNLFSHSLQLVYHIDKLLSSGYLTRSRPPNIFLSLVEKTIKTTTDNKCQKYQDKILSKLNIHLSHSLRLVYHILRTLSSGYFRERWDLNPRPPAWQAGVTTIFTTLP